MEIEVVLSDNKKVDAKLNGFTISSDQPEKSGGNGTAPGPYDYFMASTALCAGYFVKTYCDARKISYEGIKISQMNETIGDQKYKQSINISIEVPSDFPEKHKEGLLRAVEGCTVKKTIDLIPEFKTTLK